MGGNFSEPVPDLLNASGSDFSVDGEGGEGGAQFGYVCFVLRSYDKLRLLHATPEVLKTVTRVLR